MATLSLLDLSALSPLAADSRLYVLADPAGAPLDRYVTGATLAEFIRDTIGTALVEAGLVDITVNDAGDTITITSLDRYAPRTWLYLPGTASNGVTTPDAATLDILGDLEIVARVALDDWTPAVAPALVAKANNGATNFTYMLGATTDGKLRFVHNNGSINMTQDSTAHGFADGSAHWVKVTLDVNNGAAGHDIKFYTAPDEAYEPTAGWVLLSSHTVAATTVTANSAYALGVGMTEDGALSAVGKVGRAIVRNGIAGTLAADLDLTAPVAPRFRDSTGKLWTFQGSAWSWMVA